MKSLESRKNKLLEMLNKQAEEKGERAERLEKVRIVFYTTCDKVQIGV